MIDKKVQMDKIVDFTLERLSSIVPDLVPIICFDNFSGKITIFTIISFFFRVYPMSNFNDKNQFRFSFSEFIRLIHFMIMAMLFNMFCVFHHTNYSTNKLTKKSHGKSLNCFHFI